MAANEATLANVIEALDSIQEDQEGNTNQLLVELSAIKGLLKEAVELLREIASNSN